ncbi:MAG: Cysteine desulfurase [Parcubacteria bacterium OLB19]|nr:MAG: Cysteine desulfurase [Parcubacteria bacterium OLB19]
MNNDKSEVKRVHLDNAAATPLKSEVFSVMSPFLTEEFGNPSSIHKEGVRARRAVDEARSSVARTLEIKSPGVIFTGNGTESNNLAIFGYVKYLHRIKKIAYQDMEVVTTKIEHPSITGVMEELIDLGVFVKFVEVDEEGIITIPALEAVLSEKTVLVTFAYANSEVGTVQPVLRLVRRIRKFEEVKGNEIKVHLDAAQAPLWLPCAFKQLGVDMMTLDAGKCGGPKGVGVLALRGGIEILPIMQGGGQEDGVRSGTENVAGIVGMAKALELAQANYKEKAESVAKIRDEAIIYLQEKISTVIVNGGQGEVRLANNINFSIPNLDTEYAVIYLDTHGVACSTKSACAGAGGGESIVVKTITGDATRARSTIRFSLGENTNIEDVKYAIDILATHCEKMQG